MSFVQTLELEIGPGCDLHQVLKCLQCILSRKNGMCTLLISLSLSLSLSLSFSLSHSLSISSFALFLIIFCLISDALRHELGLLGFPRVLTERTTSRAVFVIQPHNS